jgi:hypothetical protein
MLRPSSRESRCANSLTQVVVVHRLPKMVGDGSILGGFSSHEPIGMSVTNLSSVYALSIETYSPKADSTMNLSKMFLSRTCSTVYIC